MPSNLPQRVHVVFLTFAAVFICYIDRVNISVAIIPMAEEYNWGLQTQGMILSSFAVGYILLQVIGGRLADRYGGKISNQFLTLRESRMVGSRFFIMRF